MESGKKTDYNTNKNSLISNIWSHAQVARQENFQETELNSEEALEGIDSDKIPPVSGETEELEREQTQTRYCGKMNDNIISQVDSAEGDAEIKKKMFSVLCSQCPPRSLSGMFTVSVS